MTQNATETTKPPPRLTEFGRARSLKWNLALAFSGAAAFGVLFLFNPADHGFYPRCVFHQLTGWNCPGCGGTRALHQLLHGHIATAWALNPLAVLLVPGLAWFGVDRCLVALGARGLPKPNLNAATVWIAVLALIAFGILRNVPWH